MGQEQQWLVVVIIVAFIPLTFFGIRWQNKRTRRFVEDVLAQRRLDGKIVSGWMPPLRLWLKNRKGDGWCRVQMSDGQILWARVRNTLFSGRQIEFFD